jgi:hypothetical protein
MSDAQRSRAAMLRSKEWWIETVKERRERILAEPRDETWQDRLDQAPREIEQVQQEIGTLKGRW